MHKETIKKLQNNIPKEYFYTCLSSFDLTRGIWMIYLAHKGMSLMALGLLETFFHITSFAMEIPTGAIADLYSRKTSRFISRCLSVISLLMILFCNNFLGYSLAFIITGLSYNLESGAGEALVYDSLLACGQENKFMKINGQKEMVMQATSVFAFVIGGYLASKTYELTFYLTALAGLMTVFQVLSFQEPPKDQSHSQGRTSFKRQIKDSLALLKASPRLIFLIIFVQFIGAYTTTIFFYLQNAMKIQGYEESAIGLVYAAAAIMCALIAPRVHKIEARISERNLRKYIPILLALCTWAMALSPYPFVFYIPMVMAETLLYVAFSDYINRLIPPDKRATLLSMSSMVFSSFMIVLFPLVGFVGQEFSLVTAFLCLAVVSTGLSLVNMAKSS